MHRKIYSLLALFLFLFPFLNLFPWAFASNFTNTYIRLDNQNSNTSISGLACATPAASGTESKVAITFPSDFTISSSASNWSVSTSDITPGSEAWPGIGANAQSVSGQTVTFSSSDLSAGTLYCFNFSSSSSSTGSSGNKTGTITTKNSSNAAIDSTDYAISIVSSGDIVVTASVSPKSSDYSLSISQSPIQSAYAQNTTITYTINYGTTLATALPLTINASWSQTTNVADYVVGSAANAYNSTAPVVDTTNQTITWSISSFPGNTSGQTVSFQLKTNSNYTGSSQIAITAQTYLSTTGFTSATQTVTSNYQYSPSSTPTPTPTPTPAPASSSTSTPTPTPAPAPSFAITSVGISSLSDKEATIDVVTNSLSTLKINYGTSPASLSQSLQLKTQSFEGFANISGLKPDTSYYYKVKANDSLGNSFTSDIFTFKTSTFANAVSVDLSSFVAASQNTIVSKATAVNSTSTIVLPVQTGFGFKFEFDKRTSFKKVIAFIRSESVLGFSNLGGGAEAAAQQTQLVETSPGIFTGRLSVPTSPGKYAVYVRAYDVLGNITEKRISELFVIKSFTVLSKSNNQPIEGARILISIYNVESKKYEELPPTAIAVLNPSFTNSEGIDPIVLPQGKYKAQIAEIGYKIQTVYFEITPNSGGYPTVYLERKPITIQDILKYTRNSLSDVFIANTATYVLALTGSIRFFNIVAFLSLLGLIIITLFSFVTRSKISIFKIPSFLIFSIEKIKGKNRMNNYLEGFVKDDGGKIMSDATVYLVDLTSDEIIGKTETNAAGHFFFRKNLEKAGILVMKKGYKTSHVHDYKTFDHVPFELTIHEIKTGKGKFFSQLNRIITGIFALSFELLLFLSIIFEILFLNTFGLIKTSPFLALSIFNIFIWTSFLRIRRSRYTT